MFQQHRWRSQSKNHPLLLSWGGSTPKANGYSVSKIETKMYRRGHWTRSLEFWIWIQAKSLGHVTPLKPWVSKDLGDHVQVIPVWTDQWFSNPALVSLEMSQQITEMRRNLWPIQRHPASARWALFWPTVQIRFLGKILLSQESYS